MTETITVVCTVLALVIGYLSFKGDKNERESSLSESRKMLLERFDILRRMNTELINEMTLYGERTNSFSEMFMQGLTLKQCLAILQEVKEKILTDDTEEVLILTPSKERIASIDAHVQTQTKHHSEMLTYFNLYIKPKSI